MTKPKNHNLPWTPDQIQLLASLWFCHHHRKNAIWLISLAIERTPGSIESQLMSLRRGLYRNTWRGACYYDPAPSPKFLMKYQGKVGFISLNRE